MGMIHTQDSILHFLEAIVGLDDIAADADIFRDLGVTGDDFHEMIAKYASTFSVDMNGYLWYFHANEEGQGIGGLFVAAPYERVQRIPVTPAMLTDFANKGRWDIEYPAHDIPPKRYDLLINLIVTVLFFVGLLVWLLMR